MSAPQGQDRPPRPGRRLKGRAASRMMAIQALYQIALSGAASQEVVRDFADDGVIETGDGAGPITLGPVDRDFFATLVEGVGGESEALDNMLAAVLVETWPVERLELVLKLILRAGAYELGHLPAVPARVAVSQYVDLAHAFLDDKQAAMVNGVLDRLAHALRPEAFDRGPDRQVPDDLEGGQDPPTQDAGTG